MMAINVNMNININMTAILIKTAATTTTTTTTTTRRHLHAVLLITLDAMCPLEPPVALHHALLRQASQQLQAVYILRVAARHVTHDNTSSGDAGAGGGHAHTQQLALVAQHAQKGMCGRGLVSAGQQVTDEHVEGNWVVAEEVDAEDCLG